MAPKKLTKEQQKAKAEKEKREKAAAKKKAEDEAAEAKAAAEHEAKEKARQERKDRLEFEARIGPHLKPLQTMAPVWDRPQVMQRTVKIDSTLPDGRKLRSTKDMEGTWCFCPDKLFCQPLEGCLIYPMVSVDPDTFRVPRNSGLFCCCCLCPVIGEDCMLFCSILFTGDEDCMASFPGGDAEQHFYRMGDTNQFRAFRSVTTEKLELELNMVTKRSDYIDFKYNSCASNGCCCYACRCCSSTECCCCTAPVRCCTYMMTPRAPKAKPDPLEEDDVVVAEGEAAPAPAPAA